MIEQFKSNLEANNRKEFLKNTFGGQKTITFVRKNGTFRGQNAKTTTFVRKNRGFRGQNAEFGAKRPQGKFNINYKPEFHYGK